MSSDASKVKTEADVESDMIALADLLGAKRYAVTELELTIWRRIVEHPKVPRGRFKDFLTHHVMTSTFAPQPNEAMEALGLLLSPEAGFRALQRLVSEEGPYRAPDGVDPVLVAAINEMGGWAEVCEKMPDPATATTYAVKQFRDDFDSAFRTAANAVNVRGRTPDPLRAIGQTREQPLRLRNTHVERLTS